VTALTAEFQIQEMRDVIERRRIGRRIAAGSATFTTLIAVVGLVLAVVA
jgi:hypothetical protein